jgi:competence protein ComGC
MSSGFLYKKRWNQNLAGFTVIELILLLCGAGLVLILLIPVYKTAKERATQRSTMADMRQWANAISAYITDYGSAPANPRGRMTYKKPILKELLPYFSALRWNDWWGHPYRIWTGQGNQAYGLNTMDGKDFIIASLGEDESQEYWIYDPAHQEAGFYPLAEDKDFAKDIVLWNNQFIHRPKLKRDP